MRGLWKELFPGIQNTEKNPLHKGERVCRFGQNRKARNAKKDRLALEQKGLRLRPSHSDPWHRQFGCATAAYVLKAKVMQSDPLPQQLLNTRYGELARQEHLLPIKVTRFYQNKIDEEVKVLGHSSGPLHRCVYPTDERLTVRAPHEMADFVEDNANMPAGLKNTIVRKYRNRILFFPTSSCAAHCQYCFRQDLLAVAHDSAENNLTVATNNVVNYLKANPDILEVILSGGDPMLLPYSKLQYILSSIGSIDRPIAIRIHTRMLAFAPSVFTADIAALLSASRVRLVNHIIHPYEVCDVVKTHVSLLTQSGVRLYNQFPIIRNVNDHHEVLTMHLMILDELNIRNLSMFVPDPINFSASFRISLNRLFAIIDRLNTQTPAWINSTRLVLDTKYGKVRREDLRVCDPNTNRFIFCRNGQDIFYQDFPKELDHPGELRTLLWKHHEPHATPT